MEKNLVVERSSLPPAVMNWLEADSKTTGIILFYEEGTRVVLERLENIDPTMLARVRDNMRRYHAVYERLADS